MTRYDVVEVDGDGAVEPDDGVEPNVASVTTVETEPSEYA